MIIPTDMTLHEAAEMARELGFPCDPFVHDGRFREALDWLAEKWFKEGEK